MKFGIMFANAGPLGHPQMLSLLARTAEEAGYESIWTVEHSVVPVGYESTYPYDASGKMPAPEEMPLPDPILPLVYAAAVTTTLKLGTGILILPQRHPIYVAKEIATLDVLSNGRAIFGIGVGWLAEEFEALGIPFAERAGRTAESVRAIRQLWGAEPKAFEGKYYRWKPVHSHPKPVQQPGVPIVVGGHTELAARRAARYGDGFFPGRGDIDTLQRLLGIMREECAKVGRDPATIEVTTGAIGADLDTIRRYRDLGVSRFIVPPPGFDPEGLASGLRTFGEHVIAKV